jgi:hypothetical protein
MITLGLPDKRAHVDPLVESALLDPALGGLTPRQAVEQGGTVLDELKALLDDFDWASRRPADMSGKRIRALLGL